MYILLATLISLFPFLAIASGSPPQGGLPIRVGSIAGTAIASSWLVEEGKPADFYGAARAFDNDPATAWCTGDVGTRKYDWIALELPDVPLTALAVIPGHGQPDHSWQDYRPVSEAELHVERSGTKLAIETVWLGTDVPFGAVVLLPFLDAPMDKGPWVHMWREALHDLPHLRGLVIVLAVPTQKGAYPGQRHQSTCVAEIQPIFLHDGVIRGDTIVAHVTRFIRATARPMELVHYLPKSGTVRVHWTIDCWGADDLKPIQKVSVWSQADVRTEAAAWAGLVAEWQWALRESAVRGKIFISQTQQDVVLDCSSSESDVWAKCRITFDRTPEGGLRLREMVGQRVGLAESMRECLDIR